MNMKYDSVFDVLGHTMVGPSSSHTAGACRIGFIAQKIFGGTPKSVDIYLHGSFSETYRGHKTDVALVAGLLGLEPDDPQIPFSFSIAKEKGMDYSINFKDLGSDYHPNSVLLIMHGVSPSGESRSQSIIGSSIGGGNIIIKEIDGLEAGFNGDFPTLIEVHKDIPGVLAKIMAKISHHNINVLTMQLSRSVRKKIAMSWIELSETITEKLVNEITAIPEVKNVRWLNV